MVDDVMEGIFSMSNEHEADFFSQENEAKKLELILMQTGFLKKDITRDMLIYSCGLFTNLIFSIVVVDGVYDIYENEEDGNKRTLVVFLSPKEAKECADKYGGKLIFFRIDDLFDIKKSLNVEKFALTFSKEQISVNETYLWQVIGGDFFHNANELSRFVVSDVSSYYDDVKAIYNERFKKYPLFKKLWLAHIKEYKDTSEYAENGNYEPEYDVIVADMADNQFINMREFLQSVVYNEKGFVIRVALAHSDLGKIVLDSGIQPFFIND